MYSESQETLVSKNPKTDKDPLLALKTSFAKLPEGVYLEKHRPAEGFGDNVYALRHPSSNHKGYSAVANCLEPELAEFLQAAFDLVTAKDTGDGSTGK